MVDSKENYKFDLGVKGLRRKCPFFLPVQDDQLPSSLQHNCRKFHPQPGFPHSDSPLQECQANQWRR